MLKYDNRYLTKEEIQQGYEIAKSGNQYLLIKYVPYGDDSYLADIEYQSVKLGNVIKYLKNKRKGER